jgi:hypothetical protein
MPHHSLRADLLEKLDNAALAVARSQLEHAMQDTTNDISESESESSLDVDHMNITPPSPISPILSEMSDSDASSDHTDVHYNRLQDTITALRDEVERARVLHRPDEPLMRASQLHLLDHFIQHRPLLFRKKLRVDPDIFDDILDQISDHPIFHNHSNNPQLPVAIQLAIFLNRAGHYGNAVSPEDVSQWAGVSVGSVINCTNRVMIAILDQHDTFISFPTPDSEDAQLAQQFAESCSCPEWRNGFLAIDGSAIGLLAKPGYFGETFYDRKSNYSLNCQVSFYLVIFYTERLN